ncbi:hypothetical protein [Pedobacter montanisoli]|uniref:Uncharacterized protein n=1 Tax=Pedobacter montanisoli TaxID=2923277 RepID=A0ABS9ZYE8_9SPHI|nr:hypothetical protein [Pedobacter montanisoli]MCJ0743338.1 hypothetical protein [Pedobacter montanisoli]
MKINFILIAVAIVALLGFIYYIISNNNDEQNEEMKQLAKKSLFKKDKKTSV